VRVTSDFYFNWNGEPISVDRWAELMRTSRILAQDVVGNRLLKTVQLGFINPAIPDTSLFGSALLNERGQFVAELGLYDSREAAHRGHARLLAELKEKPEERG
jgi:hypothetical protein